MLTRLSVRRFLLRLACCGGVVILLMFYHQSYLVTVEHEKSLQLRKEWFYSGGTKFPEKSNGPHNLFTDDVPGDRILQQLMYLPNNFEGYDSPEKVILAYNGIAQWHPKPGNAAFQGCPVNRCSLTESKRRAVDADAIYYQFDYVHPGVIRPAKQIWIYYTQESPYLTNKILDWDLFNWTATYRKDSDVVDLYGKWIYFDSKIHQKHQHINYAANKTKKVAWFVSNCKSSTNGRLAYARELAKYIPVDIYGKCGTLQCLSSQKNACFEMLERDYKFYLAFENANCKDYITEKLYENALGHNVLPIVMGARPEDYKRDAPEGSYIHVDEFDGPAELASYLLLLDQNDTLYNSYFKWKGTGEFINTYFWCRLCAMLHAPLQYKHYENVNEWWRGSGVCTRKSWRGT